MLFGLVHLWVVRTRAVLHGAGRCDQRSVHHGTLFKQQALGGDEYSVDRGQHLQAQIMGLEQVTEPQNGAPIGHVVFCRIQPSKLTKHRYDQNLKIRLHFF